MCSFLGEDQLTEDPRDHAEPGDEEKEEEDHRTPLGLHGFRGHVEVGEELGVLHDLAADRVEGE